MSSNSSTHTNGSSGTSFGRNPSLVVTPDHRIKMEDAPIREPGSGEVLLHIRATGICGSDLHLWRHGNIGDIAVENECILGHEAAGEVLKLGPGVQHLKVGDRVAVEPGVSCGKCFLCVAGRYNLCQEVAFSGMFPHQGTVQRYKVHAASHVHTLPNSMSFATAALLEPISVALHALRTSPVTVGTPVAVFGAGPIGLFSMAVARASGAHPIVITDIDQTRLQFAKRFEPNCMTYQVQPGLSAQENGAAIRNMFAREDWLQNADILAEYDMPALVLECTGMESSIATAAYTVRRGGCINVVGVSSKSEINNVPFMVLSFAEIKLLFINRYFDTWPAAIRAIEGKLIDPEKLKAMVTHTFELEKAIDAMEFVGTQNKRSETVVKVQIVDGPLKRA